MPIYEYHCANCGTLQEEMFSIKNFPAEIPCKLCAAQAHKIISKTSFVLAGGGWAADGYTSNIDKFKANMKAVDNY